MSYFGSWVAGPPRAMSERVQRRNTNQQQIGISEVGVPETSSTVVTYISCNGLVLAEMLALWIAIDAMLSAFLLNKGKMSTLSIAIQHPTRNLTKKKKKRHWDLKGWQKKKKTQISVWSQKRGLPTQWEAENQHHQQTVKLTNAWTKITSSQSVV